MNLFYQKEHTMYKKILLLLIACGTLITIDAQEHTMELTLGQTIERARRQSPDAQTAQHSFRSAYWNYKYYRANYLPALKLTSDPYLNRAINKITMSDGSVKFVEQNLLSTDLTLSLTQNIPWTGGTLFVETSAQRLDLFSDNSTSWQTSPINAKQTLEEMLSFLSGDSWKFVFRKREESENEKTEFKRWNKSKKHIKDYDQLCMFSGGLDSFIGAIDLLEKKVGKTLFISHYGGGKGTKEFQDALKNSFIEQYLLEERDFHQYYATVIAGVERYYKNTNFNFSIISSTHAITVA